MSSPRTSKAGNLQLPSEGILKAADEAFTVGD